MSSAGPSKQQASPSTSHVFVSHSTKDDPTVAAISRALRSLEIDTWTDSRRFSGGDKLEQEVEDAIDCAHHFIAVLSLNAVNSKWVKREIDFALNVEKKREDGFKVIPVLIPPIESGSLGLWFGEEPIALKFDVGPAGIDKLLPRLMEALGYQLPTDAQPAIQIETTPIADLILELSIPTMIEFDGKHRASATARLIYDPAEGSVDVTSRPYAFTAPLGPIETEDLSWYLERYINWPTGVFQERAEKIVKKLPQWGRLIYDSVNENVARNALEAWKAVPKETSRRFTVLVDQDLVDSSNEEETAKAMEAATLLLGLPWELIHDEEGYLFLGLGGVRVRRKLPNRKVKKPIATNPPLRVLLVSPRPEDDRAAYIDHRVSARPVVEALARLGALAEFKILTPPTFPALQNELERAAEDEKPYHVVHFDGHGVFSREHGLGALCFEDPEDVDKLRQRRTKSIDAGTLAAHLRDHRVPLFFLEACQSAQAEKDPTASVAGKLLQAGVASVAAMSHSVLVETAKRFVGEFYGELIRGRRVGQAMLKGQQKLKNDTFRGKAFTGDLHLEDWFVPVLFQEDQDPQLIHEIPAEDATALMEKRRELALGKLPDPPEHNFIGRSRELLAAERLLERERYVVLRGEGGEGKTTIGIELARWLVATRRFDRAAFVSLEEHTEDRAALYALGPQLVPNFASIAGQDEKQGWLEIERELGDQRTVIVLDNMESVLEPPEDSPLAASFEPDVLRKILELCQKLQKVAQTRLIFTSRQEMPEPFAKNHIGISRLDRREAIELVGKVLGQEGRTPQSRDPGESEDDIEKLVDAVNCHARSLVLLAREVSTGGVRNATERIHELMTSLAEQYPDDRERSLYASVELSLQRLPEETREKIRPLGVFQGGGTLQVMARVLDIQRDEVVQLGNRLVGVGLGEILPPVEMPYLRLHPALGPLLLSEMTAAEREAAHSVWAEAIALTTDFLVQQQHKYPERAKSVTLLELPNFLASLKHLQKIADPARVVGIATNIERLLLNLGRHKALSRAAAIREESAQRLGEWSHAGYLAEGAEVDRLINAGRLAEATERAQAVVQRAKQAGEDVYPEGAYDLASTYLHLGRALRMGGNASAALKPLDEARKRFQMLADAGNEAPLMENVCLTERADCLTDLGRLDEAAAAYEDAGQQGRERSHPRSVAINKVQLARVRILQRKYAEALATYDEALEIFEGLGEPSSVATTWHHIGMVHEDAGEHNAAEKAYQQSLQIKAQTGDRSGEASTTDQLGLLYQNMGRLKESVRFHRQAAAIRAKLKDRAAEGTSRNNGAIALVALHRYDEARNEIERAIECKRGLGHAVTPWTTFAILGKLETAVGNGRAAAEARQKAIDAYLAYRRDGGQNLFGGGRIFEMVRDAVAQGQIQAASQALDQLSADPDIPEYMKALIRALQAILADSRDAALAADPKLNYQDADELRLLLEELAVKEP